MFSKNPFFDPENMKKLLSKVAHNWSKIIFFSTGLAAQMAQKQKSYTTKSPLMQNWVFRLGLESILGLSLRLKRNKSLYIF